MNGRRARAIMIRTINIWEKKFFWFAIINFLIFVMGCGSGDSASSDISNACGANLSDNPGGNAIDGLKVKLSTDRDTYISGQNVELSLTVTNISGLLKTITFNSSQEYDFIVCKNGREIWKWSYGKGFLTVITNRQLQSDETLSYPIVWNKTDTEGNNVSVGDYSIYGILTADPSYYSNIKTIRLE